MRYRTVTRDANAAFQALADPTRRAVLDALRDGGQAAGQIAAQFPVSRPAVSKHLRVLVRADLVRERRDGRYRFYELNADPLKAVDDWVSRYRSYWDTRLASLKQFVERRAAHAAGPGRRNAPRRRRPHTADQED